MASVLLDSGLRVWLPLYVPSTSVCCACLYLCLLCLSLPLSAVPVSTSVCCACLYLCLLCLSLPLPAVPVSTSACCACMCPPPLYCGSPPVCMWLVAVPSSCARLSGSPHTSVLWLTPSTSVPLSAGCGSPLCDSVHALHLCHPCVTALHLCTVAHPCVLALHLCTVAHPCVSALHLCTVAHPCVTALHLCTVALPLCVSPPPLYCGSPQSAVYPCTHLICYAQ